jgi:hypothetical protein
MRTALAALMSVTTLTALSAYTEQSAHANGRFPRAQTVIERGDTLVMRTTFGVIVSHDAGKSFDWLCEQALGFSGPWDPPLVLTDDGELFLGMEKGLRSTKDGCGFRDHHELDGQLVSDLTDFHGEIWAATSTTGANAFVWRTEGGTFVRRGKGLPGIYIDTLDVYRGKLGAAPGRVYLTGIEVGKPIAPHFFRSDDDGVTFTELHPTWPNTARLFIAAIDPVHSERVFVRSLGTQGSDLLLTEDAGKTFRVVLHFDGAMFGFAMRGGAIWVGSGTPTEGLHLSLDDGKTFTKVRDQLVYCLHAGVSSLYACSEPFVHDGIAWTQVVDFSAVRGPLACDAGDGTKCVEPWAQTKLMIAPQLDASTWDASATNGPEPSAIAATPKPKSTCGCTLIGAPSDSRFDAIVLAVLGVALLVLHRRGSR